MPDVGDPAPTFTLPSSEGGTVDLESLRGRPVVLYFYPKDDTPGCTRQACAIRDAWDEFARAGAVVLGVSPDSVDSHARFRDKHRLPFPLLADDDHRVAEAYGAWGEKTRYGKTSVGLIRSSFVIDADGRLAAVKRNVNADRHREWALAELARLPSNAG
jgi:thioredoxin-dependent peroxiredoxin